MRDMNDDLFARFDSDGVFIQRGRDDLESH